MTTFFTSDTHFGHENIIRYCDRPFTDIDHMDAALIENWNKVVGPDDRVFHLGDFSLLGYGRVQKYFDQLNGRIFILSNVWHHDRRWIEGFKSERCAGKSKSGHRVRLKPSIAIIEIPNPESDYPRAIVLCHYAMAVWDRKHYGAIHLHGHSHGKYWAQGNILDVGVDSQAYAPVSLEDVCTELGVNITEEGVEIKRIVK